MLEMNAMSAGAKVLVVEDEEPLALLLRYNLEAEGYTVDVVHRGDEAEVAIAEGSPDLIVLVWMLPGLWQIVFSLGFLASCRVLPRPMFAVGVWYLAAGLVSLALASGIGSPLDIFTSKPHRSKTSRIRRFSPTSLSLPLMESVLNSNTGSHPTTWSNSKSMDRNEGFLNAIGTTRSAFNTRR